MEKMIRHIIREELLKSINEQEIETSAFSEDEEKFLSKFIELGTDSLGIIYAPNEMGIREFLGRSGPELNLNMQVFQSLTRDNIISLVPYGGYSRNEDYTIKLNIPLQDLEGITPPADDKKQNTGGEEGEDAANMPATPTESVETSQDLAKKLVLEAKKSKKKKKSKVHTGKSRALKRLPGGYVTYLERIIQILGEKVKNDMEKEHLVADILDNLSHNFGLTPKQVYRSFIYYKSQNRLANIIKERLETDETMIKLKELLKQSTRLNLFEQTGPSKNIVNWFKQNKPNLLKNLKTAGAGPGDLNQGIPSVYKVGEYGPVISIILSQMSRAYKNKGFEKDGTDNKLATKNGQWQSTLEKIPVKFNSGGKMVTNSDQPLGISHHNQYVAIDVEAKLRSINNFNIAQWITGKQIVDVVPTEVTEDNYKTRTEKQRVRFITQEMGKAFMNKLITGSTKQQLILWLNYESKTVKDPGTPPENIPAQELPPLDIGDAFESGKAVLKPDVITSLQESIANMKKAIEAGMDINKIPVMTIQAGTDREPLSRTSQYTDNAQLAAARAETFKKLLVAGGIPENKIDIDATTNIEKGAALYTSDPAFDKNEQGQYTSTQAERQAVIDQWREDQAPFRFVRLNFAGLKIPGKIIPGKAGQPDRLIQSMIKKQDTSRFKQSDEFLYKLTINMLK